MHAIRVMIRSAYKTHTTLLVSTLFTLITLKLIVLASPLLLGWAGAGALLAAVLALFYPAVAASALGIVAVALLTATISSILDANQVDIINNAILNEFRDHQPQ
ncbi:hypothetical protein [Pseudomonas sp. P97.38]|uniref:hypothetical protein n=1 Tax=Pseudomonas sp. P97.38 TaxID=255451 RepID=UPI00069D6727|nr:hypothetical protein [Pseudomonas sp. P97.38]